MILARILWLQGEPDTALRYVNRTMVDAAGADHPVTLLVALMYAVSVLIWNGDFDEAGEHIARFVANAETYDLASHVFLGRCFQAQLAISRGDTERGVAVLRGCLHDLRARRYELMTTSFNLSLVEALIAIGRYDEGLSLIEATLRSVETNGDRCHMPELLRVKANLLLHLPQPQDESAEDCLQKSLIVSRRQGALAWELRTSIDLAKYLAAKGEPQRAGELLQAVFDRFTDSANSADLRIAAGLLATWD